MIDYIVVRTEQLAISGEGPHEALQKITDGDGIVMSVNYSITPRPVSVPKGVVFTQQDIITAAAATVGKKGK